MAHATAQQPARYCYRINLQGIFRMGIKAWQIATLVIALGAIGVGGYAYMEHGDATAAHAQAAAQATAQAAAESAATQAQAVAEQEQEQLQTAEAKLADERRPDLPVNFGTRRALLSAGKVGIFHNTSGRELEFTLDLDSPATGRHVRKAVVLNPNGILQIGAHEGWAFAPGQRITLNNPAYRPLQFTVGG
jgi:hypothetical protein